MGKTVFLSLVSSNVQIPYARLLIASLREFGGCLKNSRVLLFSTGEARLKPSEFEGSAVEIIQLKLPQHMGSYYFGGKAAACAQAEAMLAGEASSLVWMSNDCLFLQPPELLRLDKNCDAALRPVHIRNIGLLSSQEPDPFWRKIYEQVGLNEQPLRVEAFIGKESLQAYFNSHLFAVNPDLGLMGRWYMLFEALVLDEAFQRSACADTLHQVFLHQAILSALLAQELGNHRIRILPPVYSYPYNLQEQVPTERRAHRMDDLVCLAHEYRNLDPEQIIDIEINEPLRSWLKEMSL